ncbi:MAG TPA: OmpA family protein [Nevskiaceae bacterium]|nr:OmpA family protein [Nevskiaceae bacterium]
MRPVPVAALVAGLFVVAPASAVHPVGYEMPYALGGLLAEFGDSSRDSDTGEGFHLGFGLPLSAPDQALEVRYFDLRRDRDLDGQRDYQTGLSVHWVKDFGLFGWSGEGLESRLPQFQPFVMAGGGAVQDDVRGDKNTTLGISGGGGALFPIGFNGWALRAEALLQGQVNDETVPGEDVLLDTQVRIGLQIPLTPFFGKAAEVEAAQDCELAVVDPVTGRSDCAADSDRDGVADGVDACPGTPAGTRVDATGCALPLTDDDGDGVLNADDACPGTAVGMKVDGRGCLVDQQLTLRGVNFLNNSAELTEDSRGVLAEVADALRGQPDVQIEIAGHTDSIGDETYNLILSEQRAQSVRQFLIARGVDGTRLTAQGYGEFQPVASNELPEGRNANRRVEFKVIVIQ